jgi:CHAD domain-containing protein
VHNPPDLSLPELADSDMNAPTRFRLPDGFSQEQIDAILAKRTAFLAETPLAQSWRIYDTFDWRLFSKSLTLQWSGEDLVLRAVLDGDTLYHLPSSTPPQFVKDLPEGVFRAQLAAIIEMRALLELAIVHTWSCTYRLLNKDEKTVARIIYTEARLDANGEDTPRATYLTVRPLRGYGKQAGRLAAYLQHSLDIAPTNEDIHIWALRSAGHAPGAYSGKLDVNLQPGMKAGKATRLILRHLLETMRANESGIKADVDTEFLHDYRIAVRRTRSALSQIRKVFPPDITEHFKREFRELGQLTNELRDLDVYLLAEGDYRAMLPDAMQEDITPLFEYLRFHRSEALTEVVSGLESDEYTRLIEEWEKFLQKTVNKNDPPNASIPIIKLARKRITRQYQSIVRDGAYILDHTEDGALDSTQDGLLHALRIECKKLRYLLEFFASLFPRKKISRMIKQLKRLQDNLGEFSDLTVQQEFLLSIAESLDIDEARAKRALVATGYLVETLERKRQEVRADFAETFKKFASPAHQKQFRKAFAKGRKGKS